MKQVPNCLITKEVKSLRTLNTKLLKSNYYPSPPKNVEFVHSVNLTNTNGGYLLSPKLIEGERRFYTHNWSVKIFGYRMCFQKLFQ